MSARDFQVTLRGEESGLSDEEIAFYDALAENESARELMGEPAGEQTTSRPRPLAARD